MCSQRVICPKDPLRHALGALPTSLTPIPMSFVSWYSNQFGTWNRTRRLRQTQFLARTDTNTSRMATAIAQHDEDTIMIHMMTPGSSTFGGGGDGNTATHSTMSSTTRKPSQEPLFGPNIGFVSTGPSWAVTNEKKIIADDLTPDVVKGWIERSKQVSQPTTTLQALVNLKRPTLRLLPLAPSEDPTSPAGPEDEHHAQQHHGLEFEYDCDAPKCGIYLHVFLPKDHPDAPSSSGNAKLLVFETVTEGGFGKVLKLEDGAVLELDRFEQARKRNSPSPGVATEPGLPPPPSDAVSESTAGSEITEVVSPLPLSPEIGEVARRRKFAPFHFRKKAPQGRSVAGPALAVVDMGQVDPVANGNEEGGAAAGEQEQGQGRGGAAAAENTRAGRGKKEKDEGKGVKVMIRLAALDEMGTELMSPNEQVTYLHIVRFGTKDSAAEGSAEDTRPWVVKVVKREATIGPHTFHLHEIYGLTYSTCSHPAPTAELPTQEHSYPPSTPLPDAPIATPSGIASGVDEDDPQSECLLCLSAPREVVLLPCRHLVACRDCALNMVEFGAGGQITQPSEDSGATGTSGGETAPTSAGGSGAGTGTTNTSRRRRKAKGWYCPVCRQPYTSLLRITAHPPSPVEMMKDEHNDDDQSRSHGVREVTNGVQEMDVSDQLTAAGSNVADESSTPSRSGSRRFLTRVGRRPGADENV